MTIEEMEALALHNRPEVREAMYKERIHAGDVRKAMLRMLPGLEFSAALNHDGNSFTLYNQWGEAGAHMVWNLVNLVQGPTAIKLAENRQELGQLTRQALLMSILTQTHLAYRQYFDDQRKLKAALEVDRIDQGILRNIAIGASNESQNRLEYIHAAVGAIMSRLQLYESYATAQNAVGRIFVTLGVDLAPKRDLSSSVSELADALRVAVKEWNEGAASRPGDPLKPAARVDDAAASAPETAGEPTATEAAPVAAETSRTATTGAPTAAAATDSPMTAAPGAAAQAAATPEETARKTPHAIPEIFLKPDFFSEVGKSVREAEAEKVEIFGLEATEEALLADLDNEIGTAATTGEPAADAVPTAAAPEEKPPPVAGTEPDQEVMEEIGEMVHNWLGAWSNRDEEAYFSFYSTSFIPPGGGELAVWKERMSRNFKELSVIHVEAGELMAVWEKPKRLRVNFRQYYSSNRFRGVADKTLIVDEESTGWMIVSEASTRMADPHGMPPPSGYALQAASVQEPESARMVIAQLRAKGLNPRMIDVMDDRGRLWYSIRFGWHASENLAKIAAWRFMWKEKMEVIVVPGIERPQEPQPVDDPEGAPP